MKINYVKGKSMNKKVLFIYPHGLGDCILATPALRAYKKITGNYIGFAMLERFKSAQLLDSCPYVDELLYTKDAWNDFESVEIGKQSILRTVLQQYGKDWNTVQLVWHNIPSINKIQETANILFGKNVSLNERNTQVFITEDNKNEANLFLSKLFGKTIPNYGFIHSETGVPAKDLPPKFGKNWLEEHKGLSNTIEIGVDFKYNEFPIGVQFEIMRKSTCVCLADSVFYHACHAMGKPVDFAYFQRGTKTYNRVKPITNVEENIVFSIGKH